MFFGTLIHLVSDHFTAFAYNYFECSFGQFLIQRFCMNEILLYIHFGVMIYALVPLFTIAIHIIPTKFAYDMLQFANIAEGTKTHVEVGTCFKDVPVWTNLSSTAIPGKIRACFYLVTEIASLPIWAVAIELVLITCFYFCFVVWVGAVRVLALAMDEAFTYPIIGEFIIIMAWSCCLHRLLLIPGLLVHIVETVHAIHGVKILPILCLRVWVWVIHNLILYTIFCYLN